MFSKLNLKYLFSSEGRQLYDMTSAITRYIRIIIKLFIYPRENVFCDSCSILYLNKNELELGKNEGVNDDF